MHWMSINRFCRATGDTKAELMALIREGELHDGIHYKHSRDQLLICSAPLHGQTGRQCKPSIGKLSGSLKKPASLTMSTTSCR